LSEKDERQPVFVLKRHVFIKDTNFLKKYNFSRIESYDTMKEKAP